MKAAALALLFCSLTVWAAPSPADREGVLPPPARTFVQWAELLEQLRSRGLWYGMMAASARMAIALPDIRSRRTGLETAITLGETGYPAAIKSLFLASDLEPETGSDFANSYFFYKALVNQDKGLKKWADYYFKRVNTDKSEVFKFYTAVKAYGGQDSGTAKKILSELLAKPPETRTLFLTKRIARTLARIQFEEKDYEGSLDIYLNFLLKLPVITPGDWLEAAWCYFHLKRFPQALGMLYNLESQSAGSQLLVEKYVLRGLIYHALCNRPLIDNLIRSFEYEHKSVVSAIRTGEALTRYPQIGRIQSARNAPYFELKGAIDGLKRENREIGRLSRGARTLASYLYSSELSVLQPKLKMLEPAALAASAEALMLTYEGLRFISFEITKSRFDPDKVFKTNLKAKAPLVEQESDRLFRVIWEQPGDYWLNERLLYLAEVEPACTD